MLKERVIFLNTWMIYDVSSREYLNYLELERKMHLSIYIFVPFRSILYKVEIIYATLQDQNSGRKYVRTRRGID